MTERILIGIDEFNSGSIIKVEENRSCDICRICKKVICFSDHGYDDTDEMELIICEDCLKTGIKVINE